MVSGLGPRSGPVHIGELHDLAAPAPTRPERLPSGRHGWQKRHLLATVLSDTASVIAVVVLGYMLGLGTTVPWLGNISPGVGVIGGTFALVGLLINRAWDSQVLGQGAEEFRRVLRGMATGAISLGLLGLALQALAPRPWVFGLLPLAAVLAIAGRLLLRTRLHHLRKSGRCSLQVLAIGTTESIADLIERTRRDHRRGWIISGACTPTGTAGNESGAIFGVPVLGDLDAVARIVGAGGHQVVAVCPTPGWTSHRLHRLSWALENVGVELVVDPGLMEVAGPRLHIEPVDGLPLLRLTRPTFSGVSWIAKHVVDRVVAALLLVITAPLLIAIAIGVKLDGGPVLFSQLRVGRHGKQFRILKFRSMTVNAESMVRQFAAANDGAGPLFKMRQDPRVTPMGSILRRYSLDELPQLVNVLTGTMSLVGPRPPLPAEVATYGHDAQRKLLVRPGLTGLWQISGRSDLPWEQSVRLDLRYVENWNLALDAQILCKTIGAVVNGRGAY